MKIAIDLNVLLDVFQNRETHKEQSALVLNCVIKKQFVGVISAHHITTLYYVLSKFAGKAKADQAVAWVLDRFTVGACDQEVFVKAHALGFADFEDAVVSCVAQKEQCAFIVTRNVLDFHKSPVPAATPADFLGQVRP